MYLSCHFRGTRQGDHDTDLELRKFERLVAAFEAAKAKHKAALKPQLADPNQAAVLQALCQREAERTADVRKAIVATREQLLQSVVAASSVFTAKLLYTTETLMKLLDQCIIRADLAPLPGDEDIVPQRMSLKRLKKSLKKRAAEKAADPEAEVVIGPSTKVLRPRDWPGIRTDEYVVPPKPQWLQEFEKAAGGGDADADAAAAAAEAEAAAAAAKKGKGKGKGGGKKAGKKGAKGGGAGGGAGAGAGAGAGEEEEAGAGAGPQLSATVHSFYTAATRHAFKSRAEAYATYLAWFKTKAKAVDERCTDLWQAETDWESNWATMVEFLQKELA